MSSIMTGGRRHSEGITSGHILIPAFQFQVMKDAQQDFLLVRSRSGGQIYVYNTPQAIAKAHELHGIMLIDEWLESEDPEYLQFMYDVKYAVDTLKEWLDQLDDIRPDKSPRDDLEEEFMSLTFKADSDEDPDYLAAIFYTAFRELSFSLMTHPAIEHQFGDLWKVYIVT